MGGDGETCGEEDKFTKGGEKDISSGPLKKRRCTDVLCILVFLANWAAFFGVTFAGVKDGDPEKLYRPRDYRGGYCGLKPNNVGFDKQVLMMNVSETTRTVAQQLVCSTTASSALRRIMANAEYNQYLCACCLTPCASCNKALGYPDLTDPSELLGTVTARMAELTNPAKAASLFSSGSSNSMYFSGQAIWQQITKYFVPVCLSGTCAVNNTEGVWRTYTFTAPADAPWKRAWDILATDPRVPANITSAIATQFTFQALPRSRCPYAERYCVPFPGVQFQESTGDYCTPKVGADVVNALGQATAAALQSSGVAALAESTSKSFGAAMGDLHRTMDTLGAVVFWSFIIGLLFVVLLRFFVGCMIWFALLLVLVLLTAGGGVAFLRSHQCVGAGFLDTSKASATAVVVTVQSSALTVLTSSPTVSEAMTGNGMDYRGAQTRTRTGKTCQQWSEQSPHDHGWTSAAYPNADLTMNYCRNPSNASTIWCLTTDSQLLWDSCDPVGVIFQDCPNGFEVASEQGRYGMRICAYVLWVLAGIWFLLMVILSRRIRLAIAISKVAAMFIYQTPTVVLVPLIQITVALGWCVVWVVAATFLLSQVPEGYTPTESFATYAEAYGTETVPGKCTDKWPTGSVWKDEGDLMSTNDPCSGNMGNITGIVPRCWRCAPPRYVLDVRFAYSFFAFLWNNAFLVAVGQCTIAAACAIWFFTPRDKKGKHSPAVLQGAWLVMRYHIGSLAFGSLILAIVQFLRYLMLYLQKQAEAQKNRVMVIVFRILRCCLWCFEKIIKFINKNAYIQIAILGKNFCTSAKNAFFLVARNALRFGTMMVLGQLIHVVGFMFIMVASSLLGYFMLQTMHPDVSPIIPVICYFIISYFVAELYMSIFSFGVDTSLQCFLAAEEMEDSADFVPQPLLDFVAVSKQKSDSASVSKQKTSESTASARVAPVPAE